MQAMLSPWEVFLILAVVMLLFSIGGFPFSPARFLDRSANPENDSQNAADATSRGKEPYEAKKTDGLVLWLASGFGIGRIPWAPGTFGSVIGLLWFAILLSTQYLTLFVLGIIAGLAASIV